MRKPIDIIIPIYNGYEDLIKCIESVKKYTDLSLDRVIMINDCSPDQRIKPLLENEAAENIIFIDNDKNMGFSNNVNKGMLYSEDRDVILLNSDTIVTNGWVDKLYRCAYSQDTIGTVTPMSNSATLCSYPITCMDNDIPDNYTVELLAEVVERASMHKYPRITVAVGFCMYIKRVVINDVGLFDAETFERGYGEENDFCNRAEQYGYIHVMCDDTLIYHKGTVSFASEEKQKLIDAHTKVLEERYPQQMKRNSEYCQENPDKYIRDNIDIYATADPNKKNIMYVIHSDFRSDATDNMGGTQYHVRDLVSELRNEYNVYVVARDRDMMRVTLYTNQEELSLKFTVGERDIFTQPRSSKMYDFFSNILKAFKIDVLHVHHTIGIGFDVVYVAKELGIPVILTMHDFFYICPNVKLVNSDMKFCHACDDEASCSDCLRQRENIYIGYPYLKCWRNACIDMLQLCDEIVVPSESAKEIVSGCYSTLKDNIRVIEHGTEINQCENSISEEQIVVTGAAKITYDNVFDLAEAPNCIRGWVELKGVPMSHIFSYIQISSDEDKRFYQCTKEIRADVMNVMQDERYAFCGYKLDTIDQVFYGKKVEVRVFLKYDNMYYTDGKVIKTVVPGEKVKTAKYNVAFLGGMVVEKGSRLAIDLIKQSPKNINWHIFGNIGDSALSELQCDNLIKHGPYQQQELPTLMKNYNIDMVCIMPIWPETFCYTISEAAICGVPVFVTDIGAVGERVKRHGYGWTVQLTDEPKVILDKLVSVLEDQKGYNEKKKKAMTFKEKNLKDMAQDYILLYKDIADNNQVNKENFGEFDREFIFSGLDMVDYKLELDEVDSANDVNKPSLLRRGVRKIKRIIKG